MCMTTPATIEDIKRIAPKIKDSSSLCGFLGKTEKEYMVAETIHACKLNHKNHGQCFSFDKVKYETRLAQNLSSLDALIEDGLLVQGKFKGKKTLIPTKLLIGMLDAYFAKEAN